MGINGPFSSIFHSYVKLPERKLGKLYEILIDFVVSNYVQTSCKRSIQKRRGIKRRTNYLEPPNSWQDLLYVIGNGISVSISVFVSISICVQSQFHSHHWWSLSISELVLFWQVALGAKQSVARCDSTCWVTNMEFWPGRFPMGLNV